MQKPVLLMIWKWDGWILCDCSPCCIALCDFTCQERFGYRTCTFLWAICLRWPQGVWGCGGWSRWALFHRLPAIICPQPTRNVPFFSLASQSSPLKPSKTLKKTEVKKLLSNSLCICCVILCRTENSVTKKGLHERASVSECVCIEECDVCMLIF